MISQECLKELISYNSLTGIFTLKKYRGGIVKEGGVLGNKNINGYVNIRVNGRSYKAHRLAFLYMVGFIPAEVDHINRVKDDNRWENLKASNRGDNCRNRSPSNKNCLPVGVYRHRNKFKAMVGVNYTPNYLGLFETPELAERARKDFIEHINNH